MVIDRIVWITTFCYYLESQLCSSVTSVKYLKFLIVLNAFYFDCSFLDKCINAVSFVALVFLFLIMADMQLVS